MQLLSADTVRVDRLRTRMITMQVAGAVAVLLLAFAPYVFEPAVTSQWIKLFYLITLATTWNLLAGYAGMVSVGQQAYIGLGAYGIFVFNDLGMDPYSSALIASIAIGVIAFGLSFVAFRLRGGYFAIGTWVIAEVVRQVVIRFDSLGAGRGRSIVDYTADPILRNLFTYWLALGILAATLISTLFLLRSRMGVALQSIRDDEVAARALGIHVGRTKRIVFVVAGMGAGLAGSIICLQAIGVQSPSQIFSVSFSAFMVFMVLIGGIGTIEGPIVGAVIYWVMDIYFSQLGLWYLVVLGVLAIAVTLFLPNGLWCALTSRFDISVFPVGHRVIPLPGADSSARPRPAEAPVPVKD
ncbi:branched-chain amino acid ABC transporter permease [Demequina capsici]|uniref:Branched-chain amino acid ABC transporter permease n=1 Tax=Demequina capsici TaxID=3075620 RepID=A0AA96FD41_9MICO|nr:MULTISPECIES: branched-chain amino acid ABC transporter permease [unclassified Demequina]WNM24416.1 branched-chain amino acid ABC transporter permease [Demequina sp. OYTSA14]WNM27250.1 branched-chain amino acid ABC transporter permease [Demequina sp. PMTSA13]